MPDSTETITKPKSKSYPQSDDSLASMFGLEGLSVPVPPHPLGAFIPPDLLTPTPAAKRHSPADDTTEKPPPKKLKTKATKLSAKDSVASSRAASPSNGSQPGDTNTAASSQGEPAPEPTTKRCKHCGNQVNIIGFDVHSKSCLRQKKEARAKKNREEEKKAKEAAEGKTEDTPDTTTANGTTETPTTTHPAPAKGKNAKNDTKKQTNKKRKAADNESETGSAAPPPTKKQKKKDAAAAATADSAPKPKPSGKPKGPVDVERQCGVPLPNGSMCARSLTCKSHSMGAKRAVVGRSMPYDILLAQYQKKNQARQQKAALAANQPLPEDLALDGTGANGQPVDSDEEKDAVMAGIARAAPRPLFERHMISTQKRYQNVRIKDMLTSAMSGARGGSIFAVPQVAVASAEAAFGKQAVA